MNIDEFKESGILVSVLHENWEKLGFTPLYLFKLLELGWTYDEVCFVLGNTIGKDFAEINISTWIERLKAQGVKVYDEDPFIQLLDRLMFVYLETHEMPNTPKYII